MVTESRQNVIFSGITDFNPRLTMHIVSNANPIPNSHTHRLSGHYLVRTLQEIILNICTAIFKFKSEKG